MKERDAAEQELRKSAGVLHDVLSTFGIVKSVDELQLEAKRAQLELEARQDELHEIEAGEPHFDAESTAALLRNGGLEQCIRECMRTAESKKSN